MPSPEHGGQPPEEAKEQTPAPYYAAYRYQQERLAKRAYDSAQQAIYGYTGEVDLSAYRFLLNQVRHVAVLGVKPPDDLEQKLKNVLASGEPTNLPEEILRALEHRRTLAAQISPWVEGHHRPGRRVILRTMCNGAN
jgi:hypothetical protein